MKQPLGSSFERAAHCFDECARDFDAELSVVAEQGAQAPWVALDAGVISSGMMQRLSVLFVWGSLSGACSPSSSDGVLFGELPYLLPTEGSQTQSIAMTKADGSPGDLLLESGCVTFAEVHCDGAVPSDIHFWRYCRQEGEWRQLPSDAFTFAGAGVCAEYDPRDTSDQLKRCVGAKCDEDATCRIVSSSSRDISEESSCGAHANGSAAGTTTDCSWGENTGPACDGS